MVCRQGDIPRLRLPNLLELERVKLFAGTVESDQSPLINRNYRMDPKVFFLRDDKSALTGREFHLLESFSVIQTEPHGEDVRATES
jgi:hypothetical protein